MKITVVGPIYPYRGGIAHHTTMLVRALTENHHVQAISFRRQYPRLLYPGRSDRDPSQPPLCITAEYLLDPIYPWTWWQTINSVVRTKPDVVLVQWWTTFWAPAFAVLAGLLRRKGIPLLFMVHNVLPHEARPWDAWLARWALGLGEGFVVQSQDEKARLLALLPRRRVEVVPHPIHDLFADLLVPQDQARKQLGLSLAVPVLLFFGFVREYKGLRCLLEAMPIVKAALVGVKLLIVGEFWQNKHSYQEQIARLDIEQNVIVVDRYVSNEEAPLYFSAASVVVLPYTQVTQSSVVQLAFGFGVPVIATRVGGLPEMIGDRETGLLVEPQNPVELAKAIIEYCETAELEQHLRENIRRRSGKQGWERLSHAFERLAIAAAQAGAK